MIGSRFALAASLAGLFLAACGGSQPMTGAASASTGAQSATRSAQESLKGYYLAKFATVVGSGPPSSFCLKFTSSGSWVGIGDGGLSGTYLTSGKELFASAIWLASPAVFLSLQGSVNAKRGSGAFVLIDENGSVNGGGTYTMTREQNSGCRSQQAVAGAPSAGGQPARRFQQQSLNGYYLTKFTTAAGSSLPGSSLCIRFKSSGSWSSSGSENFNGTYLSSGKELYAAGIWLPSPAFYMSLQGSVTAKQGSGTFVYSTEIGDIAGGGTFAMTGKQNKTCS